MIRMGIARLGLVAVVAVMAVGCNAAAGAPGTPSAAPAAAPSGGAATIPADFPLGSWTMTVTEEDLRAGGISEAALIKENTGTQILTFVADGTWITAQTSTQAVNLPVFRGTWAVSGDHEFTQTTEFPPEYAGEKVRFTWQLDGGSLLLRVPEPPDSILKTLTEAHPWQPK